MSVDWAALQDPVIIGRLVLQVVLFIASATFSMSETALFSLRDADVEKIEDKNAAKGGRVRTLLDEPRQLIISILCGNELINSSLRRRQLKAISRKKSVERPSL